MKKLLLWLPCALPLLALGFVSTNPQPVTLAWNAQPGIDAFYLYQSTNVALPAALWQPVTNTAGSNASVTITMTAGQMFFFVTASNLWGESGPSNITNTPVAPGLVTNLNVRRGN